MHIDPSDIAANTSLAFFKRKFPYYAYVKQPYRKDEKKMRKYNRISNTAVWCVMFYFFTFPLLFAAIISVFASAVHTILAPKGAVYYESSVAMYLTTGFPLTLGTLVWLYEWMYRLFLQSDYPEYADFYNDKQGYDNHKAGVYIGRPFLVIALLTLPFSFGAKLITSDSEIIVKEFTDINSKKYAYSDVKEIVHYIDTTGKKALLSDNSHYRVVLADATFINPMNYKNHESFINTVSAKSGKPIVNMIYSMPKK